AGNIGWPLKVAGAGDAAARHARVGEVMRLLGIEHLAARYPNEISGGQQQRVAIARMVAPRPKILLFDEPLSNLDAKLRVEMRTELMRIHRATGATSVYVTHDQVEALTMASHVAVLKDGAVEQFGSPDELLAAPRTAFVAGFMGTPPANLVPVAAADGQDRFGDMALGPASGAAHVMYRAEQLGVAAVARERSIRVVVAESVPVAGRMMVTGLAGALRLSAVVDGMARVAIGETVHMVLPSVPAARFDATGARLP
ncbi:MAG: ABC transporter ATP-binding protein, partial [Proteobacteria bacterium]|nr:ABC transporter ATP-binding protein [Pseudomonadota bacterium]